MKSNMTKGTIIAIGIVLAIVATTVFIVVPTTTILIVAYIFTLIAIAMFTIGMLYMIMSSKSYPWFAAFPLMIKRYLITQLMLSAVFIVAELAFGRSFPTGIFIALHIIVLAVYTIFLLTLLGGKEIIETREAEVKEKVATIRFMQADVESLIRKFPEHNKPLKQVAEAIRYSDPMSHDSLAVYEEQIQRGIALMNDGQDIDSRCEELLRLIADRNSRVKVLK